MAEDDFLQFVLDQLQDLGVSARSMFGGHGLYHGETFFAAVFRGSIFFKTDEATRQRYIDAGAEPFRPKPGMTMSSYYEVPADVIEDRQALCRWAADAVASGSEKKRRSSRKPKAARKPAKKPRRSAGR